MSDFLCGAFGIEQTSNHLPERPEGDSCIVITPRTSNGNARSGYARSQGRRADEADMNYRGYRNNNTYQSAGKTLLRYDKTMLDFTISLKYVQ